MNNQEVVQDFRRRWESSYAWLFMDKLREETLVYINRVEDNNDKVATITVASQKYGQLVLHLGSEEYELRFKYPPVGVFQHGEDVYLFRRRPARQYRRGICPDNSVLWNITRNIVGNRARFDFGEVQSAFNSVKYTEQEALMMLAKGRYKGVALANNYALTLSMDTDKEHVLWHWEQPVARMNAQGEITRVIESAYAGSLAEGVYRS